MEAEYSSTNHWRLPDERFDGVRMYVRYAVHRRTLIGSWRVWRSGMTEMQIIGMLKCYSHDPVGLDREQSDSAFGITAQYTRVERGRRHWVGIFIQFYEEARAPDTCFIEDLLLPIQSALQ